MSLQRLFNAAQSWHKCIYAAITTVYADTRFEVSQSRHNTVWLLCSMMRLLFILSRHRAALAWLYKGILTEHWDVVKFTLQRWQRDWGGSEQHIAVRLLHSTVFHFEQAKSRLTSVVYNADKGILLHFFHFFAVKNIESIQNGLIISLTECSGFCKMFRCMQYFSFVLVFFYLSI